MLSNFSHEEYGQITGKVESVSPIADDQNNYRVEVRLINGLKTSFEKSLAYSPEMKGDAEIITERRTLLNRIFNKLRSVLTSDP